ncbi:hypothetical protein [Nocardioides sp. YIM 152588]|uniref:hypothetical protein n=1 Tax=Nocardioides sp. YIM 152588 TaxID=3158259 RepID=UPI0032E4A704
MSDEQDKLRLTLEPPRLFGRKKKDAAPAPAAEPAVEAAPAPAEPAVEGVEAVRASDEPMTESPAAESPAVESPVEPEPAAVVEPAEPAAVVDAEPTAVLTVAPPEARAEVVAAAEPTPAPPAPSWRTRLQGFARETLSPPPERAEDEEPLLGVYRAAALTGVVVGAALVLLTWLSLRGCEAVRGTASCGGGPGFLLLLATFVVCVYLGSALLRTFQVPDPGSSSLLAVGLVAVVSLLFLVDVMDHWSMILVVPALSVGAFLASAWVTRTFVDPAA